VQAEAQPVDGHRPRVDHQVVVEAVLDQTAVVVANLVCLQT